jgi:hypothetical protein
MMWAIRPAEHIAIRIIWLYLAQCGIRKVYPHPSPDIRPVVITFADILLVIGKIDLNLTVPMMLLPSEHDDSLSPLAITFNDVAHTNTSSFLTFSLDSWSQPVSSSSMIFPPKDSSDVLRS